MYTAKHITWNMNITGNMGMTEKDVADGRRSGAFRKIQGIYCCYIKKKMNRFFTENWYGSDWTGSKKNIWREKRTERLSICTAFLKSVTTQSLLHEETLPEYGKGQTSSIWVCHFKTQEDTGRTFMHKSCKGVYV